MLSTEPEQTHTDNLLPFIKPLPESVTSDDRKYLYANGALRLPPAHLRSEIIRCYIAYHYPYMPLLDVSTLLQCISDIPSEDSPQISILLLQAVMFAGVSFTQISDLQRAGYHSHRDARKAFYEKVRVGSTTFRSLRHRLTEI
jgi:hypothetical protein